MLQVKTSKFGNDFAVSSTKSLVINTHFVNLNQLEIAGLKIQKLQIFYWSPKKHLKTKKLFEELKNNLFSLMFK